MTHECVYRLFLNICSVRTQHTSCAHSSTHTHTHTQTRTRLPTRRVPRNTRTNVHTHSRTNERTHTNISVPHVHKYAQTYTRYAHTHVTHTHTLRTHALCALENTQEMRSVGRYDCVSDFFVITHFMAQRSTKIGSMNNFFVITHFMAQRRTKIGSVWIA